MSKEADAQWEAAKAVARRYRAEEYAFRSRVQQANKARQPIELSAAPKRLLLMVCESYEVSLTMLLGARKTKSIIEARQLAMFLARHLTDLSYPEIGELMDRDHSIVMHGERQAVARMSMDPRYQARAQEIERRWAEPAAAE